MTAGSVRVSGGESVSSVDALLLLLSTWMDLSREQHLPQNAAIQGLAFLPALCIDPWPRRWRLKEQQRCFYRDDTNTKDHFREERARSPGTDKTSTLLAGQAPGP